MNASLAATKRLRKELQVLKKQQQQQRQKLLKKQSSGTSTDSGGLDDDYDDIVLRVDPSNLLLWKAWIRGPVDTPYEGGVFELSIRCGTDYPLAPPHIKFVTKVSSHYEGRYSSSFVTFSKHASYSFMPFYSLCF